MLKNQIIVKQVQKLIQITLQIYFDYYTLHSSSDKHSKGRQSLQNNFPFVGLVNNHLGWYQDSIASIVQLDISLFYRNNTAQQLQMQNKHLRDRIQEISKALKGLKASQIEEQLQISKSIVESIIGQNQITNIRSSTLLKLFTYELIIYIDQRHHQSQNSSARTSNQYSRLSERSSGGLNAVKQLKLLLGSICSRKSLKNEMKVSWSQFEQIMEKMRVIEQQLSKEQNRKKNLGYGDEDQDGDELIIEQLESLLKKKEGRIKQLNEQLQQNFFDKQELEEQIQHLQQRNYQTQQLIKRIEQENKQLKYDFQKQKEAFEKYKIQQKEDLLFGATQFMNLSFPHKQIQPAHNLLHEQTQSNTSYLSLSTKMLSKYCSNTDQRKQMNTFKEVEEERTVKKPTIMIPYTEIQQAQEENLLESVKIIRKPNLSTIQSNDNSLERMLLAQAMFIEQAIEDILG